MTFHMTRWSPVRDLAAVEVDALNRMFAAALGQEGPDGWGPALDVYETKNQELVVALDLPAVKREDIKVTFEQNVLTIEGERKAERGVDDVVHRRERSVGAFRRSLTLPGWVDASRINASYQDGVLTVTMPRREETRPRQINVNG